MTDWSAQRRWDDMMVAYIREGQLRAAQGHEASANDKLCIASRVLVRHYQRAEVGFCVHMLRGAVEHVEDLAQEVLLVAHCGWMAKSSRTASTCDDGPARELSGVWHELRPYAVSSAFSALSRESAPQLSVR